MALKAGRVGVDPKYVDSSGKPIISDVLQNVLHIATVSGNPVDFKNALEGNAQDVKIAIRPVQAGTGTQSPTNKRDISGTDTITITATGGNISKSLGQTVYGGTLDLDSGILTITQIIKTYNEVVNVIGINAHNIINFTVEEQADNTYTYASTVFADILPNQTTVQADTTTEGIFNNPKYVYVRLSTDRGTTKSELDTWLASNPVVACLTLLTPQTVTISPDNLKLIKGNNIISADSNITLYISYVAVGE